MLKSCLLKHKNCILSICEAKGRKSTVRTLFEICRTRLQKRSANIFFCFCFKQPKRTKREQAVLRLFAWSCKWQWTSSLLRITVNCGCVFAVGAQSLKESQPNTSPCRYRDFCTTWWLRTLCSLQSIAVSNKFVNVCACMRYVKYPEKLW